MNQRVCWIWINQKHLRRPVQGRRLHGHGGKKKPIQESRRYLLMFSCSLWDWLFQTESYLNLLKNQIVRLYFLCHKEWVLHFIRRQIFYFELKWNQSRSWDSEENQKQLEVATGILHLVLKIRTKAAPLCGNAKISILRFTVSDSRIQRDHRWCTKASSQLKVPKSRSPGLTRARCL